MKLIVGLGNPGDKFRNTRHNVGFVVLDALAQALNADFVVSKYANALYAKLEKGGKILELLKPQTFMNNSGRSVAYVYKRRSLKPEDVFVVHDDLDIKLGDYKIQKGKGPRVHNGLLSIYNRLRTKNFWHVRVGVNNRSQGRKIAGEDYVLQKFSDEELKILDGVISRIVRETNDLITQSKV
ncbi:aminoacyl-tRNA hydrolase [Candidatus Woesebacteria bacterium RIFCSPHIGHO2_02_FULL_42_20]|uniref:Peptidyl-tRNA hydrolase n=1 Tax=Candidatus Woesebacteria bacterium RIFCSPHIGHO2_12_FULL_41_24 TaxID=1802510 RepID=A0A1F8ARG4_9BACT|nr:MAG: aminoacyl-tRNA hydrolase [Candidatus Woesebacteria bacterium RBG_16_41_13]OGM28665.1 MAG: aminoacyl-tRNA hydrolase [Candidatus Woesebacteria bacterium RIFCSPHIGHO2_01_FULL_42_80]OGM34451.1 MAG: aminoacyl-tRNA hydrolase [Candidatus Woesebacteria bacterium RIFCSPHIGHO2_02_FULL_42_20]OGM54089.1 MAG: aminoacyl-tRNA hydrolase [Candidatus Woesebacteria bacterium RIFCSPHIGHO2_12_FULL_41_24]OGM66258.1 MAG: aminoacyl-tRNA hydrolase [Candidatus Woesebacteria bacterium RIFCSPLOWO2_01_FULL_42_67]O